MTDEKIADKVAKLLRKAEGTTNPNEAEAFTSKASELMIRHGIDRARVEASMAPDDARREPIKRAVVKFTGTYRLALRSIASQVVWGMGTCEQFYVTYKDYDELHVVGRESDVDDVMVLMASVGLQADESLTRWWRENRWRYEGYTPRQRFRTRREFLISFGGGVRERLDLQRRATLVEEERAEPGTALVVADRAAQLGRFMRENFPDIADAPPSRILGGGYEASEAGRQAGRNARVGATEVGSSRREIDGR